MALSKPKMVCSAKIVNPTNQSYKSTIQEPKFKQSNSLPIFLILLLSHLSASHSSSSHSKPPPIPILPLPSSRQLSWQLSEMAIFVHFGLNTFTDSEWGTGHADPSIFNPIALNATQWVTVAKENGFSRVILTAKHHDGFCLWPSDYTDYSVKASPWKDGNGDVVAELAEAARRAGVQLGIYLSPWDRHDPTFGTTIAYNEYYLGQMRELLTRYGVISEVFLDGAKGEGEKDMEYYFDDWFSVIHQLQPEAVIFSEAGPDSRWVGDEAGYAATTCWSLFNRSAATIGGTDTKYLQVGDPLGQDWVPAECDVSIRPGWFWHASQVPKSAVTLLDMYYKSVGRNCLFLLNIPPNTSGLMSDEDIKVLEEFSEMRRSIFSYNLAENALVSASSTRGGQFSSINVLEESIYTYWAPNENHPNWEIYLNFQELTTFNVLQVQEPIHMGQRVTEFHLDILGENGRWMEVITGTTVGYRRLLRFLKVKAHCLRLVIDRARADPLICYLGLYLDPYSILNSVTNTTTMNAFVNASQVLELVTDNHSQAALV